MMRMPRVKVEATHCCSFPFFRPLIQEGAERFSLEKEEEAQVDIFFLFRLAVRTVFQQVFFFLMLTSYMAFFS